MTQVQHIIEGRGMFTGRETIALIWFKMSQIASYLTVCRDTVLEVFYKLLRTMSTPAVGGIQHKYFELFITINRKQ